MSELEFWQAVYIAVVRAGNSTSARAIADKAVLDMRAVEPTFDLE